MKANRKADGKPECVGVSGELKPTDFLPDTREQRATWFHYMGSLTSAPFSENVSWFVIHGEIDIPPDHLDQIRQCACRHAATDTATQPSPRTAEHLRTEDQSPGTVA